MHMGYLKKISSLKEKASTQVAINLCQDNGFIEVALHLEKPTYGTFIPDDGSGFVTDPEILSLWGKVEGSCWSLKYREFSAAYELICEQRSSVIVEQCQRLTEGLPYFLKPGVHAWINHIAMEYSNYCKRLEVLYGVSRYFMMDIFTWGDLTEAGQLDEEKLAEKLINDERLPVLKRYRIACAYCLYDSFCRLWMRLTQEEKELILPSQGGKNLVTFWTCYMPIHHMTKGLRGEENFWAYAAKLAVHDGNRVAMMICRKKLKEYGGQQMNDMHMALKSAKNWQRITPFMVRTLNYLLIMGQSNGKYKLPFYYSELLCFFLSEMDEEQQMAFFEKAFQDESCDSILECFLDWPHQDDFLPTINRLWGIVPKSKYVQCLLALASKHRMNNDKKNWNERNYYVDYQSLLWKLWEDTPEEYKEYVFLIWEGEVINAGVKLLYQFLKRSSFQGKDEVLFKRIFSHQPQNARKAMMRSKMGKKISLKLILKEKWSFLNWLLEECLPKEEIPSFKKQFIQSDYGLELCASKCKENCEKVEDIINWSFDLDADKTQFKYELIDGFGCFETCKDLLMDAKFPEVEHIMNFCLSSDEMKQQFKEKFADKDCLEDLLLDFLEDRGHCPWEQMDKLLAWIVDTEEKKTKLIKEIFSYDWSDIHYELVFNRKWWAELKRFYKFFCLSPKEIRKIKEETMLSDSVMADVWHVLNYKNKKNLKKEKKEDDLVASLSWCVTDEESIISLQKAVEKKISENNLGTRDSRKTKKGLNYLLAKLLYCFRNGEAHDKTSREGVFMEDKGEKRSCVVIEDESSPPKKQFKQGANE